MQKHLWFKKSKVESYLEVNAEEIGNNKIWYRNAAKA